MFGTIILVAIPTAVVTFYALRKYNERKWGRCLNNVQLDGKVVIITGANSGIGFETAKDLAKRGASIVFACRNETLALTAIKDILREVNAPKAKLEFIKLDLASVKSIISFVAQIKANYDKLDILINNAGVYYPNKEKITTEDNFEIHFGVNYLGHFFLTHLLIDLLEKSRNARVINVSSLLYRKGSLNLDDLNYNFELRKNRYADSKLLMMLHGAELAKRTENKSIHVFTLCPGWVYTNLFRHSSKNVFKILLAIPIASLLMRNKNQGAQTTIYCATEPSLDTETGTFYRNCTLFDPDYNFNMHQMKLLWEKSEQMLNI